MADTIFARIVRKEIPADVVYEDDRILAFRDVQPQAPTHVLVIPKKPIESIAGLTGEDADLIGYLLVKTAEIARSLGVDETGYRLIVNHGADGGQAVQHLHVHILGGKRLGRLA